MKITIRLIILFAIAGVARAEPASEVETFGSAARAKIVRSATKCGADLISSERAQTEEKKSTYKVTSIRSVGVLSDDTLKAFKALLFSEWEKPKGPIGCDPMPGIRFQLEGPEGRLSVLVCNQCGLFFFQEDGKIVGHGIIGPPSREAWAKILATLLERSEARRLP